MPRNKHIATDRLSRRPRTKSDDIDKKYKVDIDDWITAELSSFQIAPISIVQDDVSKEVLDDILDGEWSKESIRIANYLTTLRRLTDISVKEFRKFKSKALQYQVQDKTLFRRASKNVLQTRVVDLQAEKQAIIKDLYDRFSHKGQERIYCKVAN